MFMWNHSVKFETHEISRRIVYHHKANRYQSTKILVQLRSFLGIIWNKGRRNTWWVTDGHDSGNMSPRPVLEEHYICSMHSSIIIWMIDLPAPDNFKQDSPIEQLFGQLKINFLCVIWENKDVEVNKMLRLFQYELFKLFWFLYILKTSLEGSKSKLYPHFIVSEADIEVKDPVRQKREWRYVKNQEMEKQVMKSCHADMTSALQPWTHSSNGYLHRTEPPSFHHGQRRHLWDPVPSFRS